MAVTITEQMEDVRGNDAPTAAAAGGEESVDEMCRRLRAKYEGARAGRDGASDASGAAASHFPVGQQPAPGPPAPSTSTGADAVRRAEVRCCPKCEGQRELREEYNFRVIYRECDHCDGEGTISFDAQGRRILVVRTAPGPPDCRQGEARARVRVGRARARA